VAAAVATVGLALAGCGTPAPAPVSAHEPQVVSQPVASPSQGTSHRYVFPVQGKNGYARAHHDYPASDIIAKCGVPVVAVTDGVVLEVSLVDTWDPKVNAGDTRGGLSVSILGDDGVRYYGSHFGEISPNINPGVRVKAGQKIGEIGKTGDARLSVCHLHFGISPLCMGAADWWIRRGEVWPWPYLDAWKKNQAKSPVAEIKKWQDDNGCPVAPKNPNGNG
jgi:murein DD-endopeptidase MepM/ murein hydrolase activator NlpD